MKVAIVHDWLTNLGGAERVVQALHEMYPDAPIYTSVYEEEALPQFAEADVRTTWLQKLPKKLRSKHQLWVPFRPRAFRRLDLSEYDLVISSSSAESKQVRVREDAVHICYCHTPIRYFWVNPDRYIKNPGLGPLNVFAPIVVPIFLRSLKKSDYKAAQIVNHFIANSNAVKDRIKKYYDRNATVVFPPVEVERFSPKNEVKRAGFLVAGRHIPYKRFDLAVQACSELGIPLTVVGTGPETEKLKEMANDNINFVGFVSDEEIVKYFHVSDGFLFPGEEDFGIVPIEAMAAGLPVVAYSKGGSTDYVIPDETGVFFEEQTIESLKAAIKSFQATNFDREYIMKHAAKFDTERFKTKMLDFVRSISK